jgi:hypothetical protein
MQGERTQGLPEHTNDFLMADFLLPRVIREVADGSTMRDSPLEEAGFERSVPRLLSRPAAGSLRGRAAPQRGPLVSLVSPARRAIPWSRGRIRF